MQNLLCLVISNNIQFPYFQFTTHMWSSIVVKNPVLLLQNTAYIRAKLNKNTLFTPDLRL